MIAVISDLDHRLRPVDRGCLRQCITGRRIAFPQRHKKTLSNIGTGRGSICRSCTVRIPIDPNFPPAGSHRLVKKTLIVHNFNNLAPQKLYDDAHASKMGRERFSSVPQVEPPQSRERCSAMDATRK
jgi:hypothetical protein